MQHWVHERGAIRSWLQLVVGVPATHAAAVEELARMTLGAFREKYHHHDRVFCWWLFPCSGIDLPEMYKVRIKEAVAWGIWDPLPGHVEHWNPADVYLWATAVLGVEDTEARRVVATLSTLGHRGTLGALLLDTRCAALFPAGSLVRKSIESQDFALRALPSWDEFMDLLTKCHRRQECAIAYLDPVAVKKLAAQLEDVRQRLEDVSRHAARTNASVVQCARVFPHARHTPHYQHALCIRDDLVAIEHVLVALGHPSIVFPCPAPAVDVEESKGE